MKVRCTGLQFPKLSCLVRVGVVNTTNDDTRHFCFVLSAVSNFQVFSILDIFETEQLQTGNWVKTRQNSSKLSWLVAISVHTVLSVSAVWTN